MIGRKDSTTEKLYRILANFSRSVKNMIGATHSSDGAAGLVPPPRAGDEDKALLGNGTWGKVDSIYKYKTEEEYNQAVANNEIPDGATVIKEWDEELSVIPVDSELSEESLNPLQNKIITQKIAELNTLIEELNGLLGGKLDVSKIANNLVTTEAGYALDARMGKELADEINKVDCKAIRTGLGSISFSKYGTYLYCGHMTTGDCSNLEPIVLLITYHNNNILGYTSIIENSRYSISINGNVLTINADYPYVLASLTYMG